MSGSLYARVTSAGAVTNIVQWDGVTPYNVAPDTLVSATGQPNAQIGGTYLGGVFTAPAVPPIPQGILFVNSPSSGATIQLPNFPRPQSVLYCFLQPAVILATLTLLLPTAPQDGDVLNLLSSFAITSLIWTPTFQGAAATLAAGATGARQFTYSVQAGNWFAW